jgi:di/tricarboxylate transporter
MPDINIDFTFWYTSFLILAMSVVLVKEWIETEVTIFATLILLVVGNVLTLKEAFQGFSNEGMLTIAFLYIIAGALYNTGILARVNDYVFGRSRSGPKRKLLRMLIPVTGISAFINNTPVVAMMLPMVRGWSEKYNYPLSKYLIPISYAAILGGMCTLIGSSTNLIVHGLMLDHGLTGIGLFEITKIGLPIAIIGIIFIVTIGYRVLPGDRKEPIVELGQNTREFVIALKVNDDYPNLGKTIEQAGLRHLTGLFLFQIEREGSLITPASPHERLLIGDRLFFTGIPKTILELQKTPGLQLIKDHEFDLKQYDASKIRTYEAVVSASSPLVGENVRDSRFREKYDAVIIAIHRNGTRINKKIGDIVLQPGDTLLLLADADFRQRWYHSRDFYLISDAISIPSKPDWQVWASVATLLLVIALTVFKILPLLSATGLAALVLIATRTITPQEAQSFVEYRVLVVIAAAFGIAQAMENSGLATSLADIIVNLGSNFGIVGVLTALYVTTSLYTLIITNNAAAAFLFPVAYTAATTLDADPRAFAIAVLFAAAGGFATPISYQTNLMVYGPGGYKFTDFVRIGLPLQILVGVMAISMISFFYF